MRTWITAAACTVLGVALVFALVHHHSNAGEDSGGTTRAPDGIDSRQVGLLENCLPCP
jgi:hypothetical protein